MPRTALAALDWFIPNAAVGDRSEVGLGRSFVVTHLFGPFLILSIVAATLMADPHPSIACWIMLGCVAVFWLLPFGLRATGDLQLMALVSVELLCVVSLVGTSFYGGVNSPFLPWLLVSLMLGFFYLSDHTLRVLALFGCNIVAMVAVHLVYAFPQTISPADLGAISWFSMFSATAYMSMMAIYYAGIITLRSELEQETERHRLMAQRLRTAKQKAVVASHGKTVFLAKMKRQFESPLRHVLSASQALIDRAGPEAASSRGGELKRIHDTSQLLLKLVQDAVDQRRAPLANEVHVKDVAVGAVLDDLVAAARSRIGPTGAILMPDAHRDLGRIRIDTRLLQRICDSVLDKAIEAARTQTVRVEALRHRRTMGDRIEIRIGAMPPGLDKVSAAPGATADALTAAQVEAELETAQLHCAVIGGTLAVKRDPQGAFRFTIEVPTAPIELTFPVDGAKRAPAVPKAV